MFHKLFPENPALYEIMWKKYCTPREVTDDNTIRRMLFAWWVTKVTDTIGIAYVTLISFPLLQWKRKCLNITLYVHCLSC